MGSRATRTVASLGVRCLRRQLHSAGERELPPGILAVVSPAISASPAEARMDGEHEDLWHLQTLLLDPEASRFGRAHQVSVKDSFDGRRHLLNASLWKDDKNLDTGNGGSFARGSRHWTSEMIAEGQDDKAGFGRNLDFLSRYLQWRSYDGSARAPASQNYAEAAAVSVVDMDGLLSLTRENCERSPHLLLPYSSLNCHRESSMIVPLEASSVKRKRKKKMNKHKQRKLRRRDRHRN